ncbi:ATP-binding protein [Intestinibacillus massiliensis]|uniref:ATP-binding protein n=1 Tax=Intestinibacillus massiliensis TaxID=1871029 RepID=UPI000B34EBDD|nr:ATP-binding protein [Intestinibacillus massiliensis]
MERLQIPASRVSASVSDADFEAMLNREDGDLAGYDCPECRNRGYFWHIQGVDRWTTPCKCVTIRRNLARMRKSSLGKMLEEYTFEAYRADEPWQQTALQAARDFYKAADGWLYVAGQPGSGKTHLCTALVGKLMLRGDDVRYMRWVEDSQRIKFGAFDGRNREIEELQACPVLYIDDFLKAQNGGKPDARDVRLAFEILNLRYANHLRTIISTEYFIDEVTAMDEALGSRIFERSKGHQIQISHAGDRNWRLRK